MSYQDFLNKENIITLATALASGFAIFNERARGYLLSKLNLGKDKAEINKETSSAKLAEMNGLMDSVTDIRNELVILQKSHLELQRSHFETKSKVMANCINNCLNV